MSSCYGISVKDRLEGRGKSVESSRFSWLLIMQAAVQPGELIGRIPHIVEGFSRDDHWAGSDMVTMIETFKRLKQLTAMRMRVFDSRLTLSSSITKKKRDSLYPPPNFLFPAVTFLYPPPILLIPLLVL